MAKAIKFNLILDSNPVRGLDDLRDNFNIEDLLGAYRNGSLKRWLESRELAREIAELEKITGDDINAARELCRIFLIGCAKEQLEAAAYPFEFRRKEAEQLRQYKNLAEQKNEIVRAYHEGYDALLKELEEKGEDYAFVKPAVAEIFRNYAGLYRLDAQAFYTRFIKDHPLVILAMLANADMRPIIAKKPEEIFGDLDIPALSRRRYRQFDIDAFLEKWAKNPEQGKVQKITSSEMNIKLRKLNQLILMLDCADNPALNNTTLYSRKLEASSYPYTYIPLDDISPPLPNHIEIFARAEDYWQDVAPQGKQFLIIKMESGSFVRSTGKKGEELKAEDVNGAFPILDGIDYKSNNAAHQLVYMEV